LIKIESDLTVVVPTYNQSQYIEARIKSILNQTVVPASIIVIDDNSDRPYLGDFTNFDEIRNGDIDFNYIVNTERNGIATKTWLQGLSLVKSKYVWIAEGDDLSEPNFVENIFEKSKSFNLDFATCQSLILNESDSNIYKSIHKNLFPNINWAKDLICSYQIAQEKFLFMGNPIENVGSCIFKTSSVLQALNRSRNTSNLTCDWEVYLNFLPSDTFGYFPKFLNVFRDHSDSQRMKTTLSQTNDQITELTIHSILPKVSKYRGSNLAKQILINSVRNNPLVVDDRIKNFCADISKESELKDTLLLINDSSSYYSFQEKLFADNNDLFNNFYNFNYLIDLPLFSDTNLSIIKDVVKPSILFVFDVFNLNLVINQFPSTTYVLFFDESDVNFDHKLNFVSNLKIVGYVYIVFCGDSLEKIDNSFNNSSILQFARLNHDSDILSDFQFLELLNYLHGILLSDLNSRSS